MIIGKLMGQETLSDPWRGFTRFTLLEEKPSKRTYVVQEKTDTKAANIQTRSFMARGMSRNAKLREKRKWAIEKPKLDNARRLRGIYFIDPEDMEFKETIKNARRKLETPVAPAMPCKTCNKDKHGETRGKTNDFISKFARILEASESTRMRMEESLPKYHEEHIAGKFILESLYVNTTQIRNKWDC